MKNPTTWSPITTAARSPARRHSCGVRAALIRVQREGPAATVERAAISPPRGLGNNYAAAAGADHTRGPRVRHVQGTVSIQPWSASDLLLRYERATGDSVGSVGYCNDWRLDLNQHDG